MSPIDFKTGVISPIECFKEGWELIKDQYWLFLGITLVGTLLAGFSMYILFGAMYCGIYYCLQQKYNRQPFEFADLFKGFEVFLPGFIVSLFFIIPQILFTVINIAVQFMMQAEMRRSGGDIKVLWSYFTTYMIFMLIVAIVMLCIHAVLTFTFPLIIEYKISGVEALKLSVRAVWGNLGGVIGLLFCQFGLMILGAIACYVGMFFVLPLLFAGIYVAYRKVFPSNFQAQGFDVPPPPSEFQNAGRAI